MTIKQQGGIFGRNPTFNNVDVEGVLTVNGEPISDFGTMAQQDANNVNIDGGAIDGTTIGASSATSGVFTTATATRLAASGDFVSNGGDITLTNTNSGRSWRIGDGIGGYPNELVFFDGTNGTLVAKFNASNNLAFPSGKGIDFSATAGTGTSELFDDYEEGTFTATITCGTSGTVTLNSNVNTLSYTKVGRQVTICGNLLVSSVGSPVGNFQINLPFTNANLTEESGRACANVVAYGVAAANAADFIGRIEEGGTVLDVTLGDSTSLQNDSAQELQASTQIFLTATYFAG
jgi:hypothetical protein